MRDVLEDTDRTLPVAIPTTLPGPPRMESKDRGKRVPLKAWSGPDGSRLRYPDFVTTAHEGGKVVSLTHRPHLPPGNPHGTHFC